jgi:hypothetical protein
VMNDKANFRLQNWSVAANHILIQQKIVSILALVVSNHSNAVWD